MSILQIEVSDETRAQIEEQAKREGRDANSWLLEAAIEKLEAEREEDEADRKYIEGELLKALDSPSQVADEAWWQQLEKEALERVGALVPVDNAK